MSPISVRFSEIGDAAGLRKPPGSGPQVKPLGDIRAALRARGMEREAVDLHDEPLADQAVDETPRDPRLLHDGDSPLAERGEQQGLEAGVGQPRDGVGGLARR